jgi:hypothetical protein
MAAWIRTKPHFFMTLEMINEKPCYFCGGFDSYRDRADDKNRKTKKEQEPSEPGDYMQHETITTSLGQVKIFECSKCHNLVFFRSHHEEEVNLLDDKHTTQ